MREAIEAAVPIVLTRVFDDGEHGTITLLAANEACGALIGRGGENLRQIQAAVQVIVVISSPDGDNERTIAISGSRGQCEQAVMEMLDKLQENVCWALNQL